MIDSQEMIGVIKKATSILYKEREIIYLPEEGKGMVIGDLHGDLGSLEFILKKVNLGKDYLIFLGDYGDRGKNSTEVYYRILKIKEKFPTKTILLRGNHEGNLPFYPHTLPLELQEKFEDWKKIYLELRNLFNSLKVSAILTEKYIFLHGGFPIEISSPEDLKNEKFLNEILWNDPFEGRGVYPSPRGVGNLFGIDITEKALKTLEVKTLIRSHQPSKEGVKVNHEGRVLTISSTRVYGGKASFLPLDFSEEGKNAYELAKRVIKFG